MIVKRKRFCNIFVYFVSFKGSTTKVRKWNSLKESVMLYSLIMEMKSSETS